MPPSLESSPQNSTVQSMASVHTSALNRGVRYLIFQLSLWIVFVCVVHSDAHFGGSERESLFPLSSRSEQREFDYFKLALQWPGTYCRRTKKCCASNGCCRGSNSPTEFTIHGLWPDYNDGSWPECCSGKSFDAKEISTLLDGLNRYWPSLTCGSPKNCHGRKGVFWEHEWEKHGTCAASVTGEEYNYFLVALNLYSKYNVTEVLREAGYVASNSEKYPLGGIVTAIQNAYHVTPEIECSGDALEELRLCFYKDFKPRECAAQSTMESGSKVYSKSCPKYVSLPEYVSSKIGRLQGSEETTLLRAAW